MDIARGPRRLLDHALSRIHAVPADASLSPEDRLEAFQQWGGHSLAYSAAVQKKLCHHGDRGGFIAFGALMGKAVALGDPVCPPERLEGLLQSFTQAASRPSFAEISLPTAEALARLGYRVMRMGVDTRLDLATYTFAGGRKQTVRYSERWLAANGYRIVEAGDLPDPHDELKRLSAEWREGRVVRRREMAFLNRPFPKAEEPLTRRFVLLGPDNAAQALLFFDPICRDGRVIGYLTAHKRRAPGATAHAEIGMTKHAVDRFKAEGREVVMLGLSPFAAIQPSGFREARRFTALLKKTYGSKTVNARIFNMQGHAAFKRRFHGAEEARYFAWKGGTPFMAFWAMLRLCKAF